MIRTNASVLIKRIEDKLSVVKFDEPETARKFNRIALLLANQTILNVRKQRLVDTGALLNSITSNIIKKGEDEVTIEWGSVGVRYAATHEYGLKGSINIPAHNRISQNGVSHRVRSHTRRVNFKERPFIRPSLVTQRRKILKILKGE